VSAPELWRREIVRWGIPEEIIARAPESPWGFPTEPFRQRARVASGRQPTPTTLRSLEALPDRGTVLDVGVGAGSTSIPLASRASLITGVDGSGEMLTAFRDVAAGAGVESRTVAGRWPDVAPDVEPADVAVCGHVFYNVRDLPPFVAALTDHARLRVVVELTDRHPWAWMNDLWLRFHHLERPSRPTADDAQAVVRELGLAPGREDRVDDGGGGFTRREDAVALVRRRLCLPPDRDPEVVDALGDRLAERDGLWSAGPARHRVVTLWWDGGDGARRIDRRVQRSRRAT
jgi:SAM-dependent methyltransferase